jgi:hypothetical protein
MQRTPHPGRIGQGKRILGCSRVGRPPKRCSNTVETKQEQQVRGLEELGFGKDVKQRKIDLCLIDWIP